jgi:hypothetical protein
MSQPLSASAAPYKPETQRGQADKKERNNDADDVHPRSRETCKDQKADSSDSHRQHDKRVDDGAVLARAAPGEQKLGNKLEEVTHALRIVANLTASVSGGSQPPRMHELQMN